ncbi:hypothetical protein HDU96_006979 [Phlyctochytrium bullatum]|nr:hypothetical protein HDU96_006979 [Phlyctochytrium bullatum]
MSDSLQVATRKFARADDAVHDARIACNDLVRLQIRYLQDPKSCPNLDLKDLDSRLALRKAELTEARRVLTEARDFLTTKMVKMFEPDEQEAKASQTLIGTAKTPGQLKLAHNQPFLGFGGTGRVFKVEFQDGGVAALKVVLSEYLNVLENEAGVWQMEACRKSGVVVQLLSPFKTIDEGSGAAMLISPVGKPVKREDLIKEDIFSIFQSLLKLHQGEIVHGDARLSNLIKHEGVYLWIDILHSNLFHSIFPQHWFYVHRRRSDTE